MWERVWLMSYLKIWRRRKFMTYTASSHQGVTKVFYFGAAPVVPLYFTVSGVKSKIHKNLASNGFITL